MERELREQIVQIIADMARSRMEIEMWEMIDRRVMVLQASIPHQRVEEIADCIMDVVHGKAQKLLEDGR